MGSYSIIIDKYEPSRGIYKDKRVDAWKHGSKAIPAYVDNTGVTQGEHGDDTGMTEGCDGDDTYSILTPYSPDLPDSPNLPNPQGGGGGFNIEEDLDDGGETE